MPKIEKNCFNPVGIQYAWAVFFNKIKNLPDIVYEDLYRISGDIALDNGGETISLNAESLSLQEEVNNGRVSSKLTGTILSINEGNMALLDQLSRKELIIFMLDNQGKMRVMGDGARGCRLKYAPVDEGNDGERKDIPLEVDFLSDHQCAFYENMFTVTNGVLSLPTLPIVTFDFEEYFGDKSGKYRYSMSIKNGSGDPLVAGNTKLVMKDKNTGDILDTMVGTVGQPISSASTTYVGSPIKVFITGNFSDGATIDVAYRNWINANSLYMSRMPELEFIFTAEDAGCDSNPANDFLNLPRGLSSIVDTADMRAVWGFKRQVDTYTGPLCRVKNKSTNTEADIYAGTNGFLDMDALDTLSGLSATCAVMKIYDQCGNGVDYVQNDITKMPIIVAGGIAIVDGYAGFTVGCCSFADATLSPDGSTNHEMDAANLSVPGTISLYSAYRYINFSGSTPSLLYNPTDNSLQLAYTAGRYLVRLRGNPGMTPIHELYTPKAAGNSLLTFFELSHSHADGESVIKALPCSAGTSIGASGALQQSVTRVGAIGRTGNVTVTQKLFNGLFGFGNMQFHNMVMLDISLPHTGGTEEEDLRDNFIESYAL